MQFCWGYFALTLASVVQIVLSGCFCPLDDGVLRCSSFINDVLIKQSIQRLCSDQTITEVQFDNSSVIATTINWLPRSVTTVVSRKEQCKLLAFVCRTRLCPICTGSVVSTKTTIATSSTVRSINLLSSSSSTNKPNQLTSPTDNSDSGTETPALPGSTARLSDESTVYPSSVVIVNRVGIAVLIIGVVCILAAMGFAFYVLKLYQQQLSPHNLPTVGGVSSVSYSRSRLCDSL